MAPRKPIRARAARASAAASKPASTSTPPATSSAFKGNALNNRNSIPTSSIFSKKDKRTVKHTHLLNRLSSSKAVSSRIAKPLKRSRKPKALSGGNLSALAAALPEAAANDAVKGNAASKTAGVSEVKRALLGASLKSRSGVQKRREELAKLERARMKGNMGVMSSAGAGGGATNGKTGEGQDNNSQAGGSTWAALRAHIAQSMAVQKGVS